MDLSSLDAMYTDYLKNTNTDSSNKISRLSQDALKTASDEELMEACKQFETYFIEQVLKHAQVAMVPKEESTDGATQTLLDYYKDSLTSEYAKMASDQQDMGLAQMLYEQMKRNYGI
ncbi:MAG: rod-binding protein [Lachnospiraceae bacterium]|nr:rod-binding protein [Lachnospiraceae bacterium]